MAGVADALGPLLGETPGRRDVKTLKRSGPARTAGAQTPKRLDVQASRRPELPLQGTAKYKHPDFTKKTLYVRKSTMRDAFRKYQDEQAGTEESELVEMLLRAYAGGKHA